MPEGTLSGDPARCLKKCTANRNRGCGGSIAGHFSKSEKWRTRPWQFGGIGIIRRMLTLLVAIISGGLAGGIVSAISNRIFHWRALRTQFYPKLSNIYSAYIIRFEQPNGRYWTHIVGNNQSDGDEEFVEHRSNFIGALVTYNELKEARVLRKAILDNSNHNLSPGSALKHDLGPEAGALNECLKVLHKKLKL